MRSEAAAKRGKKKFAGTEARSQSGEFISKWATEIDHVTLGGPAVTK